MASKGPRSKLDHESRAKRQKALETPKEPRRPKTHWDHVLEEMVWLSKDFEAERKWKLGQAKKVAIRASKGLVDQATRGERRLKEEELRLRKVALGISKDVKKFWTKIEKLVQYKHQLEIDGKKKKALDKQLEFLLGQTERYSSMLAENLVTSSTPCKASTSYAAEEQPRIQWKEGDESEQASESDTESQSNAEGVDTDFDLLSEEEAVDDEHTIEEDEALITKEERDEELAALQNEIDLPLDEILRRYADQEVNIEENPDKADDAREEIKLKDDIVNIEENSGKADDAREEINLKDNIENDGCKCVAEVEIHISPEKPGRGCVESNGLLSQFDIPPVVETYKRRKSMKKPPEAEKREDPPKELNDEQEDNDFKLSAAEETEMDDETTLLEEEELANADCNNTADEIDLLQKESEVPIEELLSRYKKDCDSLDNGAFDSDTSYDSDPDDLPDEQTNGLRSDVMTPLLEENESERLEKSADDMESKNILADAAEAARSAQPTGNTFLTTKVRTKFPFLLKYPLREYQHIGLDWLVTMYEKRLNGILADEMGLGKTIMTIALLAHLAIEKGIWGPHLIVVPTSVMLNWETEFLKWCPAFKILTYFGSAKERKFKRQGWLKPNFFHVCITTYRLVIQDSKIFKRKKWKYLILDEAHLIKNWKSQRWQTLLNFNSKRRILLTGTPLQNDLMELWSLMHFLMPHVFQSHQEFKEWFTNPISGMVEGQDKVNKEIVDRLHNVLRPFLLRRLKKDVEKQLPMKREHVIFCRLSRRQRNLYEDFIASAETQATLASTNFFGMIGVIMQLRKVCNHPDLFEGRPIVSSYDMSSMEMQLSSSVCSILSPSPFSTVDLAGLGFVFTHLDFFMTSWENEEIQSIATSSSVIEQSVELIEPKHKKKTYATSIFEDIKQVLAVNRLKEAKERAIALAWWNSLRCRKKPIYSTGLRELVSVKHPVLDIYIQKHNPVSYQFSSKLAEIVLSPVERFEKVVDQVESFMFAIPAARAPSPVCWCSKTRSPVFFNQAYKDSCSQDLFPLLTPFRSAIVRRQVYFPDRRLIQFDCGKLQELSILLRRLKSEGHRALIFTQMTKMLDVLEAFINLYGYTYMRLDGSTPPEQRQTLMQRFNTNPKYFLFILSTRSGGVGINLVGADTVIFYDSDWNPAMDQQAQDRCHRIGQTREVNIYRLISESTIEENILKKANQKRALDNLVIQSGSYNTDFFKKLDPLELFSGDRMNPIEDPKIGGDINLSSADLDAALKNAEDEADYIAMKKVEEEEAVENQEFTEETVGKLDEDELVNEEDMDTEGLAEQVGANAKSDEVNNDSWIQPAEEGAHILSGKEDDIDMLADVKQMAAAAVAAGQEILSFENQLRPIDRYAIRFLELWDPVIDKSALESHIHIEEREWELERIEQLKDEMEAEIDEEEEPLVYESWDADYATEAYRQHVETLTQHQRMEDLEREAQEKAALELADSLRNETYVTPKPKKKKTKKPKFKSLKKASLSSKAIAMKEESSFEEMSIDDDDDDDDDDSDDDIQYSDTSSPRVTREKKRKPALDEEEQTSKKKPKKLKASDPGDILLYPKSFKKNQNEHKEPKFFENGIIDLESKTLKMNKNRGKLSIPILPLKQVFTIKPEKLKKKVNIWSKDYIPSSDNWSALEDVILCASVREYGPNWNLVSENLHGMSGGGSYRGRFRHPVHCCERVRELIQKHVLSASDATNKDKAVNASSGKTLIRVTEDNMRMLLDATSERSDHERLLPTHFHAVLSTTWRNLSRSSNINGNPSALNEFYSSLQLFGSTINGQSSSGKSSKTLEFTNLQQCGKLVAAALNIEAGQYRTNNRTPVVDQRDELTLARDQLDITLEIQEPRDEALPSIVNLSIQGPDPPPYSRMYAYEDHHFKRSRSMAEHQVRAHGESSSRETYGYPTTSASQVQLIGKNRFPGPETTKNSKSKSRKTSKESNDMNPPTPTISEIFQAMQPVPPANPNIRFDESSCFSEAEILDFDNDSLLGMDEQVPLDTLGMAPLDVGIVLPSGLDDWSFPPEFADVG